MKRIELLITASIILLHYSCLKSPELEKLSSNFVVTTNVDQQADFNSYQTYFIPDSVVYISSGLADTLIDNASTRQLVEAVKENMTARGYQLVTKSANPDLAINMGIIRDVNIGVIYPGWWTGWPGWWDPWYWDWYYPYYYPWSVTYVVETGTIVLDMVDRKNAETNKSLKVVWGSYMGGAVGTDITTNVQRGINAINQAFAQSAELERN